VRTESESSDLNDAFGWGPFPGGPTGIRRVISAFLRAGWSNLQVSKNCAHLERSGQTEDKLVISPMAPFGNLPGAISRRLRGPALMHLYRAQYWSALD
jgi:hypothetical protein